MVPCFVFAMTYFGTHLLLGKEKSINPLLHLLWVNAEWLQWVIGAAFITVLIFINGYVNMRAGVYSVILLFWINAVGAVIVGMNFARLILESGHGVKISNWLCSVGRDSMVYVCLNQIVIKAMQKCLGILDVPRAIERLLILVVALLILKVCSVFFMKSRLRKLVGK